MKESTLQKLRVPGNINIQLTLESGDLTSGKLQGDGKTFSIVDGIPRLLAERYDEYTSRSFSAEWNELKVTDDVWGRPVNERIKEELVYLEIPFDRLRGLDFLDVGCGNGLFAKAIATNYHANMIAMDISTGLEIAKKLSNPSEAIDFVQADSQYPPFAPNSFDIIWCAGSLHHVTNPRKTFRGLVPLLKKDGRIFLWLYAVPEKATFRYLARGFTKTIVCRLPVFLQNIAIFFIACFTIVKQFILVKILQRKPEVPFVSKLRHHRMMARNTYTIRYDWHLRKEEVEEWHKECDLKSIYVKYVTLSDGRWLAALAQKT